MSTVQALPQYGRRVHPSERMRAVIIERYGSADELRYTDVPRPTIKPNQVLVRTRFIGVNPKDVIVRKGKFAAITGRRFPLIVGHDVAGEVVEAGARSDLKVGEKVYGMINDFAGRAYAEYAAVDANQLARAPKSIDLLTAAAVPLAAQTSLQALKDDGLVRPGHRVLINGASGGVGTFAVQIAKILGAHVTAVCSARNAELVTDLGADEHIDYNAVELTSIPQRFDTIYDVFGNYHFTKMKHMLEGGGRYVNTVPNSRLIREVILSAPRRQKAKLVIVRSRRSQLDWLTGHIDAGRIRPIVDRTFALAEVGDAHRFMETKRARGKVVLEVD